MASNLLQTVSSLSMEQHSPELQEQRARVGGSVGGTLPLRSVRASVPGGTQHTKQQFCKKLDDTPTVCTTGMSGCSICQRPGWRTSSTGRSLCGLGSILGLSAIVASSIPALRRGQKQGLCCGPSFESGQHLPSKSSLAQKTYIGNGNKAERSVSHNSDVQCVVQVYTFKKSLLLLLDVFEESLFAEPSEAGNLQFPYSNFAFLRPLPVRVQMFQTGCLCL